MVGLISSVHNLLSRRKMISRDTFLKGISVNDRVLEIGPFTKPCFRGKNVFYFDVLNKEDLISRAIKNNYPVTDMPEINFVSVEGDLKTVNEKFDIVLSSHCIEHQPDLITHLQDVSNMLNTGGRYYLIIPDKRFCFDALLHESNVAEVIEAYRERRTRHMLKSVIEHRALVTHSNTFKHWMGRHGVLSDVAAKVAASCREYDEAEGNYIDVHAWQFTPGSFAFIVSTLHELKYIDFRLLRIYYTDFLELEFFAMLEKT